MERECFKVAELPPAKESVANQVRISGEKPKKPTANDLMALLTKQRFICALSGHPLTPQTATLDHIIPRTHGGDESLSNLQWVHHAINKMKGTMQVEHFVKMCQLVSLTEGRKNHNHSPNERKE